MIVLAWWVRCSNMIIMLGDGRIGWWAGQRENKAWGRSLGTRTNRFIGQHRWCPRQSFCWIPYECSDVGEDSGDCTSNHASELMYNRIYEGRRANACPQIESLSPLGHCMRPMCDTIIFGKSNYLQWIKSAIHYELRSQFSYGILACFTT